MMGRMETSEIVSVSYPIPFRLAQLALGTLPQILASKEHCALKASVGSCAAARWCIPPAALLVLFVLGAERESTTAWTRVTPLRRIAPLGVPAGYYLTENRAWRVSHAQALFGSKLANAAPSRAPRAWSASGESMSVTVPPCVVHAALRTAVAKQIANRLMEQSAKLYKAISPKTVAKTL
jgi:hypothetical protein